MIDYLELAKKTKNKEIKNALATADILAASTGQLVHEAKLRDGTIDQLMNGLWRVEMVANIIGQLSEWIRAHAVDVNTPPPTLSKDEREFLMRLYPEPEKKTRRKKA